MINLNEIIEHFLDEAILRQINDSQNQDEVAIAAIASNHNNYEKRSEDLLRWLNRHSVFQNFYRCQRQEITEKIISFSDINKINKKSITRDKIIKRYEELYDFCQCKIPKTEKDKLRDVTSLLSKALWCFHPHSIPVFDSFAQRTLWIISRLEEIDRPESGNDKLSRYRNFTTVWFTLYDQFEVSNARLRGYPYKVRVFDKILWIVGQPDYGRIPYQPPRAETRLHRTQTA